MRAVVHTRYGPPEVSRVAEVETPEPAANEVRVRVEATTVTAVDCIFRGGRQAAARLFTGLRRPRNRVLGSEVAGVVDVVGAGVTRFTVGDRVFGSTAGFGAHAEYVCLPETAPLASLPGELSFAEAVSLCDGPLTALPFLRDTGRLRAGERVLIIGAAGSVGSAGVQIARHLGGHVTGVCGASNADLVRGLGAEEVIDYAREDFTHLGRTWDIVFDAVGKSSFGLSARVLAPGGRYLCTVLSAGILLQMLRTAALPGRKARFSATGARPEADRAADLRTVRELISSGALRPVIDRTYPLERVSEAMGYVGKGHKRGAVIVLPRGAQALPSLNPVC